MSEKQQWIVAKTQGRHKVCATHQSAGHCPCRKSSEDQRQGKLKQHPPALWTSVRDTRWPSRKACKVGKEQRHITLQGPPQAERCSHPSVCKPSVVLMCAEGRQSPVSTALTEYESSSCKLGAIAPLFEQGACGWRSLRPAPTEDVRVDQLHPKHTAMNIDYVSHSGSPCSGGLLSAAPAAVRAAGEWWGGHASHGACTQHTAHSTEEDARSAGGPGGQPTSLVLCKKTGHVQRGFSGRSAAPIQHKVPDWSLA